MAEDIPFKISIAGIGAYTPLGTNADACWRALLDKKTAIVPIDRFPLGGISCTQGGLISSFRPDEGGEPATAFALSACREALAQAGVDPARTALLTGSNFATLSEGADALAAIAPETSLRALNHAELADRLAAALGIGGPVASISLSCASGSSALALAAGWIEAGHAETILVVGVDALSLCAWSGLCSLRTMARDGVVRPFDGARAGTVFAEGACAVVLTRRADLRPLAEIAGWATGNNGFHLTAPPPRAAGSRRVMADALRDAGTDLSSIAYVSAHATSTKANDLTESQALEDLAASAPLPPVTAMKAAAGHLLGAAGIFEAAMAARSIAEGIAPPIARVPDPDPALPPLDLVTEPRPIGGDAVLTDCAGFGGCNASLVLARPGTGRGRRGRPRGRIAIRSCGFLSALGIGLEEAGAAWAEGESACFPVARIAAPEGIDDDTAGEVPDFDPDAILPSPKAYLDRQSLLLLCAAALARQEIGEETFPPKERFGTFAGTSWGAVETLERFYDDCLRKGPRLVKPMLFPHTYANAASSLLSIEWGLSGPHMNFAGGTNASSLALLEALDRLRAGSCDAALAGGAEALSSVRWRAEEADGTLLLPPGEAAAVFYLERDGESAGKPSGAFAFLTGGAIAPSADEAIRRALEDAETPAGEIARLYTTVIGREEQTIFGSERTVVPEKWTGGCDGASGAVLLACARIDGTWSGKALLLTTNDDGTAVALVVEKA